MSLRSELQLAVDALQLNTVLISVLLKSPDDDLTYLADITNVISKEMGRVHSRMTKSIQAHRVSKGKKKTGLIVPSSEPSTRAHTPETDVKEELLKEEPS